jgi:hypothetical protein
MNALTSTELRLQDAVLDLIRCSYRTDRGEMIQGNAISALSRDLRDKGWRGVSNLNDLESTVERLGFKIVRAQMVYSDGRRPRTFARCVTL